MHLPLPREHGAWAMGFLALAAGWGVGSGGNPWHAALATFAVVTGILAQAAWLDQGVPRWIWRFEALVALAAGAFLSWRMGIPFGGVGGAVALAGATAQALRGREAAGGRVKLSAFPAHLAGAVALAGCGALVSAARGIDPSFLVWCWAVQALGFAAGVGFVQAVQRGCARTAGPLVATMSLGLAGLAVDRTWGISGGRVLFAGGALAPVFLRLAAVPFLRRSPPSWKLLGWLETLLGLWSLAWMVAVPE